MTCQVDEREPINVIVLGRYAVGIYLGTNEESLFGDQSDARSIGKHSPGNCHVLFHHRMIY